ncbi:hypothetical protein BBJ28_00001679 [Nothophytophthora sp. Chile5]|nr:hypothetical protein BBJ28_00001679 [Nothophytophthora sp. Chile5]
METNASIARNTIQYALAPWDLYDTQGAVNPEPNVAMRELFRRFRASRGKLISGRGVTVAALKMSWNAFVRRWNVEPDFAAVLRGRENSRRRYGLGSLRQELHNACWDDDRYCYVNVTEACPHCSANLPRPTHAAWDDDARRQVVAGDMWSLIDQYERSLAQSRCAEMNQTRRNPNEGWMPRPRSYCEVDSERLRSRPVYMQITAPVYSPREHSQADGCGIETRLGCERESDLRYENDARDREESLHLRAPRSSAAEVQPPNSMWSTHSTSKTVCEPVSNPERDQNPVAKPAEAARNMSANDGNGAVNGSDAGSPNMLKSLLLLQYQAVEALIVEVHQQTEAYIQQYDRHPFTQQVAAAAHDDKVPLRELSTSAFAQTDGCVVSALVQEAVKATCDADACIVEPSQLSTFLAMAQEKIKTSDDRAHVLFVLDSTLTSARQILKKRKKKQKQAVDAGGSNREAQWAENKLRLFEREKGYDLMVDWFAECCSYKDEGSLVLAELLLLVLQRNLPMLPLVRKTMVKRLNLLKKVVAGKSNKALFLSVVTQYREMSYQ